MNRTNIVLLPAIDHGIFSIVKGPQQAALLVTNAERRKSTKVAPSQEEAERNPLQKGVLRTSFLPYV
jgi:hypothetical protein